MEFAIFVQGYLPGHDAHDRAKEHEMLMREAELVRCADRNNWKYCWFSEHHALPEYSHLSSSEVYMGYLAAQTERIHLGSAIFNLSPRVNHPVRNAERVAMLDHVTKGRFEFGTGRGAGSHEVGTFNIKDTSSTRSEWDEAIYEIPRIWRQRDYTFQGTHFQMDVPHNVLPKPMEPGHPAMWVACGNPPTFEKAGRHGIGALGFNFNTIHEMKPMIDAYKQGIAECDNPAGEFINDNVMLTNRVICFEDRDRARAVTARADLGYQTTMVWLYHDTFPPRPGAEPWPAPPRAIPLEAIDRLTESGLLLCGNPEEVVEQLKVYETTGVDHLAFGIPGDLHHEEALELIETFGQRVIPEFDRDPEHSTTRYRRAARPKHPEWNAPPPDIKTLKTP